jgi:DNA-binding transcriptional MerR regulator
MNTSKISRLPFNLREQLNHRLHNGEPGSVILDWLNQKPIVKRILSKWFHAQPINKQNLSDWRHGGYRDWLRHQSRQQTIQRLAEQGVQLNDVSNSCDHCESFSQIVIAELADELEHLDQTTDRNQRWQRLREISRELARLQHGFNHSRTVELAWTKHNQPFAAEPVNSSQPQSTHPPVTPAHQSQTAESEMTPPTSPTPTIETVDRHIYHRRCRRGCVCPDCHPEDGEYPYTQAVKDNQTHESHSSPYWIRGLQCFWIHHSDCDCDCDCEKNLPTTHQQMSAHVVPS